METAVGRVGPLSSCCSRLIPLEGQRQEPEPLSVFLAPALQTHCTLPCHSESGGREQPGSVGGGVRLTWGREGQGRTITPAGIHSSP